MSLQPDTYFYQYELDRLQKTAAERPHPHPISRALKQKVYVPTDDVTVNVGVSNLRHRHRWIYDDESARLHDEARGRGESVDDAAYRRSLGWHEPRQGVVTVRPCTVAELDAMEKLVPNSGKDCGANSPMVKLPPISQMLYDGNYVNKAKYEIEHEMREYERVRSERIFDCSGWCR